MVLIVIIALIVVIGGCAYCTVKPVADLAVTVDKAIESIDEALDEPKKKSTTIPAQRAQPANLVPDVKVSSVELSEAYSEDKIAAEYEYEGKLAEIIGKVIGKEKKAGLYEISLGGATSDVVCKMEAHDVEKAAKAKKGHLITVRGVIIGVPGFSNVVVQPCTIWDGK
jgi:hypothetical protein